MDDDMFLSRVHLLANNQLLTCAQCVELLMEQATQNEESHAQMHVYDRFASDPALIKGNPGAVGRADAWKDGDSHLAPPGQTLMTTYQPKDIRLLLNDPLHKDKLFVDITRLPLTDKYKKRTGLGDIAPVPEVVAQQHTAFSQPGGKGKPVKMQYRAINGGEVLDGGVWKPAAPFGLMTKPVANIPQLKLETKDVVIVPGKPAVAKSPPHSMFEDSETLAMLLCAALLSDAGVFLLETLKKKVGVGKKNVALYSNTAVAAVRAHFADVSRKAVQSGKPLTGKAADPLAFIERKAKTDAVDPRVILNDADRLPKDLNHVVLVIDVLANNHLKITTFYPTAESTAQSCGIPTKPWEDLVELDKDQYTLKPQRPGRAIRLAW